MSSALSCMLFNTCLLFFTASSEYVSDTAAGHSLISGTSEFDIKQYSTTLACKNAFKMLNVMTLCFMTVMLYDSYASQLKTRLNQYIASDHLLFCNAHNYHYGFFLLHVRTGFFFPPVHMLM